MSIQEIEQAITQLSPVELAELRAWFVQRGSIDDDRGQASSQNLDSSAFPPSNVQEAAIQDPQERLKAFEAWVASHDDVTAVADDSRDSIY